MTLQLNLPIEMLAAKFKPVFDPWKMIGGRPWSHEFSYMLTCGTWDPFKMPSKLFMDHHTQDPSPTAFFWWDNSSDKQRGHSESLVWALFRHLFSILLLGQRRSLWWYFHPLPYRWQLIQPTPSASEDKDYWWAHHWIAVCRRLCPPCLLRDDTSSYC